MYTLFKKISFLALSNITLKLTTFLLNVISARFLSVNDFGVLSLVRSTAAMFESTLAGAFSPVVIRNVAKDSKGAIFESILLWFLMTFLSLSICLYLLMFTEVIPKTNFDYFNHSVIVLIIFSSLTSLANSIYIGLEKYKLLFKNSLSSSLLTWALFIIVNLYFSINIKISASFFIFTYLCSFLIFSFNLKKIEVIKLIFFNHILKLIFEISYYVIAIGVTSYLVWFLKKTLIDNGDLGISEYANFEVCYQFVTVTMLVCGLFVNLMVPEISRSGGQLERMRILAKYLVIVYFIFILLSLIFYSGGYYLLSLINDKYSTSDNYYLLMKSLYLIFGMLNFSVMNKYLIIMKKKRPILLVTISSSLVVFFYIYIYGIVNRFELLEALTLYYFICSAISLSIVSRNFFNFILNRNVAV